MDVQMIPGQHVQRGIVRQCKTECFGVMGVTMNRRELVRRGSFGFDARDLDHAAIIRAENGGRNAILLAAFNPMNESP